MNDECIVRKLSADGDGAGDDKRYVAFINHFFKLTRERDPLQLQNNVLWLKETLSAAELAIKKQTLLAVMNERQNEEYKRLADEIDEMVEVSGEKMREAKNELVVARGVRRNKEQYELLASMIQQIPSREETNLKLSALKNELEELHEKQRKLETKLAERRNYLHSLSIILANFNRFLTEEVQKETAEEHMDVLSNDSSPRKEP